MRDRPSSLWSWREFNGPESHEGALNTFALPLGRNTGAPRPSKLTLQATAAGDARTPGKWFLKGRQTDRKAT